MSNRDTAATLAYHEATKHSERSTRASRHDEMIDIDRVDGRVKASSVKRVGEIVDKHPEESLAIVRGWLHSEA